MRSYQTYEERERKDNQQKITLRPLRDIKDIVVLNRIAEEINVPKGTFSNWIKRGDNMLETKNRVSAEHRREALKKIPIVLQNMRDRIDRVLQDYNDKFNRVGL